MAKKIAVVTVSVQDEDAADIEAIDQIHKDLVEVFAALADDWTQYGVMTVWNVDYCKEARQ